MLFERRLQIVSKTVIFVALALLLLTSSSLAQKGTLTKLADMPTARSELASCELDGKIYVIGGSPYKGPWENTYAVATVEVYDPVTNSWDTTKADMQAARQGFYACAVNGKIYAIGGATSHIGPSLQSVEEYDPKTDTWTTKASLPGARSYTACGVINNKIYVAGGSLNKTTSTHSLQIYDPVTDTWDTKLPLPTARGAAMGAVIKNKLYVIGGLFGSSDGWIAHKTVQVYDPVTDEWEYVADLNDGRFSHATAVIEDSIYVFGGHTTWGNSLLNSIERYDPGTKKWINCGEIPFPLGDHTATVFENRIYLFGGTTTTLENITPSSAVYSNAPICTDIKANTQKISTPKSLTLYQNYPNPFNPSTTIEYSIPKQSQVTITIFDVQGRTVATLVNKKQAQGQHQTKFDATGLTSGVYFYKLVVDNSVFETKRMLYMK